MRITTCIDNYINGNLTDAKRQAKRLKSSSIYITLRDIYGKNWVSAFAIVAYLKGKGTFQAACDAEGKK